ncbi:MAG: 50S ribosomal protein L4, partial [Olsenella profusa]
MSKIEVRNAQGKATDTVELSDSVFGIEPNVPVMHQVVVAYEASLRQGTHSTKNRSAVSGG